MSTTTETVLFRASSVGNLLVGGNAITEKQLEKLQALEDRANDPEQRPLTPKMEEELQELLNKRDGEFKFGQTAKSYIKSVWRENEYGFRKPLVTDELLKGIECEDAALDVLTRQLGGETRTKNTERFENDWFSGEPDSVLESCIEDVKCSWTLETYMDVQSPDPIYYAQGQVYMDLTGRDTFRLCHVLLDTPEPIVQRIINKFSFSFEDFLDPGFLKASSDVESTHIIEHKIPEEKRLKVFTFKRDDEYLDTLKRRVEQARRYYNAISLELRQ